MVIQWDTIYLVVNDVFTFHIANNYIKLTSPGGEECRTKEGFYEVAHLSDVIGLFYCTHRKIQPTTGENNYAYVNRKTKGGHFINVQAICDKTGKFNKGFLY